MKKKSFEKMLFCTCLMGLMALAGCSGSAGGDNDQTVDAGPLLCLLSSDATLSGDAPMKMTCKVAIGNAQASTEGIDTSVTNILEIDVLPGLCPDFLRSAVLADSGEFDTKLRAELGDAYVQSGSGWTVQSAACSFAALTLQ